MKFFASGDIISFNAKMKKHLEIVYPASIADSSLIGVLQVGPSISVVDSILLGSIMFLVYYLCNTMETRH